MQVDRTIFESEVKRQYIGFVLPVDHGDVTDLTLLYDLIDGAAGFYGSALHDDCFFLTLISEFTKEMIRLNSSAHQNPSTSNRCPMR